MYGRIIQIIPAVGWYAVYKDKDGEEFFEPLVCWALTDTECIIGMDGDSTGDIEPAQDADNFARFEYQPDAKPVDVKQGGGS